MQSETRSFLRVGKWAVAALSAIAIQGAFPDAAQAIPAAAKQVGYNVETFDSTFAPSLVDTNATYDSGYQWYLMNFYGFPPMASTGYKFGKNRGITLTGLTGYGTGGGLNQLATAGSTGWQLPWRGTAFGGGFYAEARFKFNAANVNPANGWPSFWASPIETLAEIEPDMQWQNQVPGYNQFSELDFFEYWPYQGEPQNDYISTVHDWYGIYDETCPGYCDVNTGNSNVRATPSDTDWSQFHTVGYLWVPATATTPGYTQSYFDGVAIGPPVQWTQFTTQSPVPGNGQSWTFGVTDQGHMVLMLDTGVNQNLTIMSVKVWQASSSKNWVQ